mmetsp:Transcript_105396/g.274326  ORF Transcript_105396/g.274326 Transcript_105396/m.274326 type:complete len:233 (+) Transcript_105396:445-1143(+)
MLPRHHRLRLVDREKGNQRGQYPSQHCLNGVGIGAYQHDPQHSHTEARGKNVRRDAREVRASQQHECRQAREAHNTITDCDGQPRHGKGRAADAGNEACKQRQHCQKNQAAWVDPDGSLKQHGSADEDGDETGHREVVQPKVLHQPRLAAKYRHWKGHCGGHNGLCGSNKVQPGDELRAGLRRHVDQVSRLGRLALHRDCMRHGGQLIQVEGLSFGEYATTNSHRALRRLVR